MSLERVIIPESTSQLQEESSQQIFDIQSQVQLEALQFRFDVALQVLVDKYPDLEPLLLRQLNTPQVGEYHKEGPTMYSHLLLIFKTLEDLVMGRFHSSVVNPGLRQILSKMVDDSVSVNVDFLEYMFLHDLSKLDCLILTLKGHEEKLEVSYDDWAQNSSGDYEFTYNGIEVESIGYFHRSKGREGMHGNHAVERLRKMNLDVSDNILSAIAKHEVAYQFNNVSARSYMTHIVDAGFDIVQQDFILVASYIDTMASLRADLKPNLTNFLNLYHSRRNYEVISRFHEVNPEVKENKIGKLYNSNKIVTTHDLSKLLPKTYSLSQLTKLQILLEESGRFSNEEVSQIVAQVSEDESKLGRLIGKNMKYVRPLLAKI